MNVTTDNGVLIIRIERPEKKNALTQAMYAALAQAVAEGDRDDSVRVMMFTGSGDVFTAGNDLGDFLTVDDIEASPAADFLRALAATVKPVVAAVNGTAIGIGATMLLHCDLVVAADDARLQFPFINLALVPEAASSLLLPRLVGHMRAAELLMLGEPFDAACAQSMGLVNRVVPADRVVATASQLAAKLADKPAAALRLTKALMKGEDKGVAARFSIEFDAFSRCLRSPELKEAVAAFFERRQPDFRSL
ncbi:enoyl-CoA hydratase [Magnetospirillum aberrantis SpK]|uniref:Enoyl-CoA hydratase n=1 Tax=Magnetospirillum aberrantis SpK TaxID=908842 RepID=A0A7C9UTE1_9PROT|nr:enoyl-CoA hydratase [Magnetospirillum aberrantis SpK]